LAGRQELDFWEVEHNPDGSANYPSSYGIVPEIFLCSKVARAQISPIIKHFIIQQKHKYIIRRYN